MAKRLFSFLLGLIGQTGCVIYDEALHRESSDSAVDAVHDAAAITRDVASDASRSDVVALDVEASVESGIDASGDLDVPSGDANGADSNDARDAPVDIIADAPGPIEGGSDAHLDAADAGVGADANDEGPGSPDGPPFDTPDDIIVGCTVDFTVSGVAWDDGGSAAAVADGGLRVVRLVGDVGQLGAWEPTAGVTMMEKAPGAWSTSIWLADRLTTQFKFVKIDAGGAPLWEQWLPFDSNRSFSVDCTGDGGTVWVDASFDGSPVRLAVGRSYGGAFGVRPLDATK